MKKILTAALSTLGAALVVAGAAIGSGSAFAQEGMQLDHAQVDLHDLGSLQAGARTFVNYCLNCHAASSVRYSSLRDIGLTDDQITKNLLFTADKVGGMMSVGLQRADAKAIFGAPPPDLSLEARARGADWIYTYLRSFYKDPSTTTGWNNTVFPHVAMPHVLWELQGVRTLKPAAPAGEGGEGGALKGPQFDVVTPGKMTPVEYDTMVRDLVNYMVWMGEPHQVERKQIGFWVLVVLGIMIVLTWLLKVEFWKDVKK